MTAGSDSKRKLSHEEEVELVERAKYDREAFGELYERYVDRIYQFIYYRVGNQQDAEDLTARVFTRVLRALPDYTYEGAPFGAWIFRIARNLVANWHRDTSRRTFVSLEAVPFLSRLRDAPGGNPERFVERSDEYEVLASVISTLHEDRQTLLFLKFYERLTNAEIGFVLGRTEGAIKALYHRTLRALRREFRRRGISVDN